MFPPIIISFIYTKWYSPHWAIVCLQYYQKCNIAIWSFFKFCECFRQKFAQIQICQKCAKCLLILKKLILVFAFYHVCLFDFVVVSSRSGPSRFCPIPLHIPELDNIFELWHFSVMSQLLKKSHRIRSIKLKLVIGFFPSYRHTILCGC